MISVEFARPLYLWLTLLIPLLFIAHYFFLHRTQVKAMRFANFETLKRISGEKLVTKNLTVLLLRFLVLLFAIIALTGATIYYEGDRNNFDYVIAIDTSSSMLTQDLQPSRLDAAKTGALTFIDGLDSQTAIGLVSFSGITFVENTLDTDHTDVRLNIVGLNVSRTSGTDLFGAIVSSSNLFTNEDVGKAIILFTDGSNTVSAFIEDSLNEAADYAIRNQIMIHAVGLGTQNAPVGYLPDIFNLTASVDREALNILTSRTNGQVLYPETTQELQDFFETFDSQSTRGQIPFDASRYAVVIMVVLLSVEWILINLLFRRVA